MRKELKDRVGRRGRFRATFNRFGALRKAWGHPQQCTALLKNVRDESGAIVADHIWVIVGTRFGALELKPGDEVFFVARVTKYRKRNPDWQDEDDTPFVEDYRLSNPSNVTKLGGEVVRSMPLFDRAEGGQ